MRSIARVINGQRVSDGAGVEIRRVIGLAGADYVDPFLMFDDFRKRIYANQKSASQQKE